MRDEIVLVTGGTGYLASWCIAELLARGYTVRATIRSLDKEPAVRATASLDTDPGPSLGCVVADLTTDDGWEAAMVGVDNVLHVAQPLSSGLRDDPETIIAPARDGMFRVLRSAAAAGVQRVVATSAANAASPSSYAEEGISDESVWTDPGDPTLTPYRRAKTIGEMTGWKFMTDHDGSMTLTTILPEPCSAPSGPPRRWARWRSSPGCSAAQCRGLRASRWRSSMCAMSPNSTFRR